MQSPETRQRQIDAQAEEAVHAQYRKQILTHQTDLVVVTLNDGVWHDEDHLLALELLSRADDAEVIDPGPIDQEVGMKEPNWLLRLDAPDGFELL